MKKDIKEFYKSLTNDEKMLIVLRDELYGSSWRLMINDLRARLRSKPYIFKLVNRIQDDIKRIQRLSRFERQNKLNLGDYVKNEGK